MAIIHGRLLSVLDNNIIILRHPRVTCCMRICRRRDCIITRGTPYMGSGSLCGDVASDDDAGSSGRINSQATQSKGVPIDLIYSVLY